MLPIGTTLHDETYRIDKHLGNGGFGNTYLVTKVSSDETFVLKEFFMSGINTRKDKEVIINVHENREMFLTRMNNFCKEAKSLQRVYNSHIAHVIELFEENGTAYFVMEVVDGISLAECMDCTQNPFDEDVVKTILIQILDALKSVHNLDEPLYHLDIKPSNIMFDSKEQNAYLIDFGASKQLGYESSSNPSHSKSLIFQPGYTPLEQLEQDVDRVGPWTDFFSLGATVYELLTNQTPPTLLDIEENGVNALHFSNEVSTEMQELIIWMMQFDRRKRPQSTKEILQRLFNDDDDQKETAEVHKQTDSASTDEMPDGIVSLLKNKSAVLWSSVAAGIIILVGFFAFMFNSNEGENNEQLTDKKEVFQKNSSDHASATDEDNEFSPEVSAATPSETIAKKKKPASSERLKKHLKHAKKKADGSDSDLDPEQE